MQDGPLRPLADAQAWLLRGQLERRLKRRARARTSLERALAIAQQLGAVTLAATVQADLARLGGSVAPGELTASELAVAELAAVGLSNTEIGAKLFLNIRTVESNLTRVYRKLNIRSRAQLSTALAALPDS